MAPEERGPGRRSFRIFRFRPDVKEELDAELEFHLTETVEELVEKGWPEGQARAEAEQRFGNLSRYRRGLERIGRRRVMRKTTMDKWDVAKHNFVSALRGLRRNPGFSAAVILTLALGIGANATMFGVVDRLLLSPPQHIEGADGVRRIYLERFGRDGVSFISGGLSHADFVDMEALSTFESVAVYGSVRHNWALGSGTSARTVSVQQASASLFPTLGVGPVYGRLFDASDDEFEAPLVAVISEGFWEREFGREPDVLGRTLELGQGRYEVVGVTPAGFTGAELQAIDVWVPLIPSVTLELGHANWVEDRRYAWIQAVVRLAAGVSDKAADAQLTTTHITAYRAWEEAQGGGSYFGRGNPRLFTGSIIAARGPNPSNTSAISFWLAGVSLIVLLIACANVANLLLARGVRERREHAIRVALGIDPARLMGQLLTEAAVLSTVGALAALLVARWSSGLVHSALIPGVVFSDT